jgi:D-sedoheptulose 7-phosphate isomerase/D-glycero-D-manno-heptose 1,7-bisphosphate phosphatase
VHARIAEHLAGFGARIDLFTYCPYHPDGVVEAFSRTSEDRKPRPGMATAAATALGLDLSRSWVVGDRPEDVGLAKSIGASAAYLSSDASSGAGVWPFPSLAAAAPFILRQLSARTLEPRTLEQGVA